MSWSTWPWTTAAARSCAPGSTSCCALEAKELVRPSSRGWRQLRKRSCAQICGQVVRRPRHTTIGLALHLVVDVEAVVDRRHLIAAVEPRARARRAE